MKTPSSYKKSVYARTPDSAQSQIIGWKRTPSTVKRRFFKHPTMITPRRLPFTDTPKTPKLDRKGNMNWDPFFFASPLRRGKMRTTPLRSGRKLLMSQLRRESTRKRLQKVRSSITHQDITPATAPLSMESIRSLPKPSYTDFLKNPPAGVTLARGGRLSSKNFSLYKKYT